jgi:hypothetical protein
MNVQLLLAWPAKSQDQRDVLLLLLRYAPSLAQLPVHMLLLLPAKSLAQRHVLLL